MYLKTYSLSELEASYKNVHQTYGETIRNYGYRLSEELEKYKNGFKIKYNTDAIENLYNKHLDENSVQIFIRGINNTILKDKIASSKSNNLNEVMEETEQTEKMLLDITSNSSQINNTPNYSVQQHMQSSPNPQRNRTMNDNIMSKQNQQEYQNQPRYQPTRNQLVCNYCQKPNHTWDICRTRIFEEIHKRNVQNRSNTTNNYPQFETQNYSQNNNPYKQNTYQNQHATQNPNFYTYRQPGNTQYFQQRQNKYCSFCKTTSSHTIEECRSKFLSPKHYTQNLTTESQQPEESTELEDEFQRMQINIIEQDQAHNQGNFHGSTQQ